MKRGSFPRLIFAISREKQIDRRSNRRKIETCFDVNRQKKVIKTRLEHCLIFFSIMASSKNNFFFGLIKISNVFVSFGCSARIKLGILSQ